MIAVLAEFKRYLIEERRVEGMRKQHARRKKEGRKPGPESKRPPETALQSHPNMPTISLGYQGREQYGIRIDELLPWRHAQPE